MSTVPTEPATRPGFHNLAALLAVACFALSAVFALSRPADGFVLPSVFLLLGAIAGGVAASRYLNRRPTPAASDRDLA